ncbi:MAG: hypothetical protein RL238_2050 [Actinomycetota bacterium]|jgi:hypothetical protein
MNQPAPRSRGGQRRKSKRGGQHQHKPDLWRTPPELPAVEPIAVPHEVGAMLRSLGDPPMNNGAAAGRYFSVVIERAAAVAVALAVSADVLDQGDRD